MHHVAPIGVDWEDHKPMDGSLALVSYPHG